MLHAIRADVHAPETRHAPIPLSANITLIGHSAALDDRARENRPWRPEETAHGVDANGVATPTIGDASTLPNGPGIPAAASHYAPAVDESAEDRGLRELAERTEYAAARSEFEAAVHKANRECTRTIQAARVRFLARIGRKA